ncbi:pyridoxamine 5'-phosphate oxidase family protein [Rhodovibrionaceae bacterium A322]
MPHHPANSFLSLPLPADFHLLRVLREVQSALEAACKDPTDSLRYATLASLSPEGEADARTLVLRNLSHGQGQLSFFSDARAPKIQQLQTNPSCCLVFMAPEEGLQLRFRGKARIRLGDDDLVELWNSLPTSGRFNYLTRQAPGSPLDREAGEDTNSQQDDSNHALASADNFAAIDVSIESLDWLLLGRKEHSRAHFSWTGESCTAQWVTP